VVGVLFPTQGSHPRLLAASIQAESLVSVKTITPARGPAGAKLAKRQQPIQSNAQLGPLKAGSIDRGDVDEHVLAAALRLAEAITLGRIEQGAVTTCMWSSPGLMGRAALQKRDSFSACRSESR
jgi:hypothetical protein